MDEYDDALMDYEEASIKPIEKSENILQRAAKYAGIGQAKPENPIMQGIQSTMGGLKQTPGLGPYMQAHDVKSNIISENVKDPILSTVADVVTDPEGLMGGPKAGKAAKGLFGKVFPYTSKEARVGFTEGVEKSLINRRKALTRGYGSVLKKSDKIVDLGHIMEPGSEITQFTMKEAQDLKNAISQGIPEAVKKGVRVDPKYFQSREISGIISDAMKKADPKIASTMEKYGKHAEDFKSSIAPIKGAKGTENIFGSNLLKQMLGSGGSIPEKSQVAMQNFAPKVAKKIKDAKFNENVFRGVRGAAIGATLNQFVPNILKRAFASEVTK